MALNINELWPPTTSYPSTLFKDTPLSAYTGSMRLVKNKKRHHQNKVLLLFRVHALGVRTTNMIVLTADAPKSKQDRDALIEACCALRDMYTIAWGIDISIRQDVYKTVGRNL